MYHKKITHNNLNKMHSLVSVALLIVIAACCIVRISTRIAPPIIEDITTYNTDKSKGNILVKKNH